MKVGIASKLATIGKLLQKGAFVAGAAFFLIGYPSVVFASPAQVHIPLIEKMREVPLEKGGLQNLLNDWDIQELQNIIDEKGKAGGFHRNNGSHDPSILEERLTEKGWPAKKIPAAKNYLHIHVLEDIAAKDTKVGDLINGHKVTYFDKIQAKYKIWRISHGWGYKPLKKYQKPGPLLVRAPTYKYNMIASKDNPSKISTFFNRVTSWFKAAIQRLITTVKNIYRGILNKFISNPKVEKPSEVITEKNSGFGARATEKSSGVGYLRNIGENISKFFGKIGRGLYKSSSVVTEKVSTLAGRVIEKVLKVLSAAGERLSSLFRSLKKSIVHYFRIVADKMSKWLGKLGTKSSGHFKNVLKKMPKFCLERLSGAFGSITKWSVAFGCITAGYSVTKEVYERAMEGQPVHPSRVIARAIVGFAGGSGGTFLFGTLLVALFAVVFPPAVPVAGFIGGVSGGVLGAIFSEQLFEIIMPLKGTGWTVSDFFIGGLFGSLIGIIPGVLIAKIFAEIRIAFRQKEKPKKKKKKTIWASLTDFFKPTVEEEIRSRFFWRGLWGGFFSGGSSMGLVFVYLFSFV